MERKDEAAVERQKLVDDGEAENDDEQTNISTNVPPTSAPKSVQTPNSPVLSNRVRISARVLFSNHTQPIQPWFVHIERSILIGRVIFHCFRYSQVVKQVEPKTLAIVPLSKEPPTHHGFIMSTKENNANKMIQNQIKTNHVNCPEVRTNSFIDLNCTLLLRISVNLLLLIYFIS